MRVLALAVMLGLTASVYGQDSATTHDIPLSKGMTLLRLLPVSTITFDFARAELKPPRWGFEINNDGKGRYYERENDGDEGGSANRWQDVRVSVATMELLKAGTERGGDTCETKAKNIAQTGKKILIYWQGDVPYKCEFNYSDDAGVMKTSNAFQAMAETMQLGERLQHDRRFDRLGLDADITSLADEVKLGHAIEVQNISGVLTSIAQDDRVIQRVRRVAAQLLQDAGIEGGTKGDGR